jgi:hypothetical protein
MVMLAALGCGGAGASGAGGSCNDISCGGDIVGAWALEDACDAKPTATLTESDCPQASVARILSASVSGMYTFNADQTFSTSASTMFMVSWVFPSECVSGGGAAACDSLQSKLQDGVGFIYSSVACAPSGSACDCTVGLKFGGSFAGTYSTAGSALTLTVPGATTTGTTSYCVRGPTLTLHTTPLPGVMGMAGSEVLTQVGGLR